MKKLTTREKILDSAYTLFYKRGYNGTSIDDILKDAKLNKGSLYHIFKGKKEVLLAVIDEKIAQNLKEKYRDIQTAKQPLKYLEEKLLTTDSFDFKHGCALNNLVQEMSPIDEDIAKALLKVYHDLENYYFLALRENDKLNKIEKQALSKMMVATVEGAIMASKATQDKTPYMLIIKQMFLML